MSITLPFVRREVNDSLGKAIVYGINASQVLQGSMFKLSGNLLIFRKHTKGTQHPSLSGARRGSIEGFSSGSAKNMRRYLRECEVEYDHMVTLTYPKDYPCSGRETKEHLRRFLQELKRCYKTSNNSKKWSAFWFLEFQERGAPHYHIFTTTYVDIEWCSETWYRIVGSGDYAHLKAGTRCERLRLGRKGTVSYAMKYANKQEQKVVPDNFKEVGRFWGVWGVKSRVSASTFIPTQMLTDEHVVNVLNDIKTLISEASKKGTIKVLAKKQDLFVAVIHSEIDLSMIRLHITRLKKATGLEEYLEELFWSPVEWDCDCELVRDE